MGLEVGFAVTVGIFETVGDSDAVGASVGASEGGALGLCVGFGVGGEEGCKWYVKSKKQAKGQKR